MASEDSVEHMLERALSLLTVRVHRLGTLHDLHQPFRGAVSAGLTEIQDHHEARENRPRARRTACSAAGRDYPCLQQRTRMDRVDQHGLVPGLTRAAPPRNSSTAISSNGRRQRCRVMLNAGWTKKPSGTVRCALTAP